MKYKLKSSVITPLTDAGVIDADGDITLNIPIRGSNEFEKMYKLTWKAATEALQTSNPRAARAIRNTTAPPTKVNGNWKIMDPAIKWFDELPDSDTTTAKSVDVDGVQVPSRFERQLLRRYRQAGANVVRPHPLDPRSEHESNISAAKTYFGL